MSADDLVIPDNIRTAIRQASTTVPPQAWDLDALTARGARRRWFAWASNRRVTGILAGVAALVAAGSTALAVSGDQTPPPVEGPRLSVFAAGPQLLYATWLDCDAGPCSITLLGSDDNGTSWTTRTDWTSPDFRLTVGPAGSLIAEAMTAGPDGRPVKNHEDLDATAVSTDGGRTWKPVVDDPQPWPSAPPGVIGCHRDDAGCQYRLTDPTTGRRSPLPQPPPSAEGQRWQTLRGTIWMDSAGIQALDTTVSRDGGQSWTTNPQPCPKADCDYPLTPGLDGTTVYRVAARSDGDHTVIRRSTNTGATWSSFDVEVPGSEGNAYGVVTPDGSLVTLWFANSGADRRAWILSPTDSQPRPAAVTGLPDRMPDLYGAGVTGNADTGYLIQSATGNLIYRSTDALTWKAMAIPQL